MVRILSLVAHSGRGRASERWTFALVTEIPVVKHVRASPKALAPGCVQLQSVCALTNAEVALACFARSLIVIQLWTRAITGLSTFVASIQNCDLFVDKRVYASRYLVYCLISFLELTMNALRMVKRVIAQIHIQIQSDPLRSRRRSNKFPSAGAYAPVVDNATTDNSMHAHRCSRVKHIVKVCCPVNLGRHRRRGQSTTILN